MSLVYFYFYLFIFYLIISIFYDSYLCIPYITILWDAIYSDSFVIVSFFYYIIFKFLWWISSIFLSFYFYISLRSLIKLNLS